MSVVERTSVRAKMSRPCQSRAVVGKGQMVLKSAAE